MNVDQWLRELLFLPEAATEFADGIDQLHFFVISVTMLGSAAVFMAALWFVIRYRRRAEPGTTPAVKASKPLEFSLIALLLSLFILWWVIGFFQYIGYATPPRGAEEVYVTGKQWMWKFSYPDGRASVGVLVVPVDRDVRLILTSRDVIHSFYAPAFRLKQDALPGRYTTAWFRAREQGVFDVYCAEYCGVSHSRMWASVVVLKGADYERWLEGDEPQLVADATTRAAVEGYEFQRVGQQASSMAEEGRKAASENGCFACHTIDGQPHIGPTWQNLYGRTVSLNDGTKVVADEEYLTRSMMEPLQQVVDGFQPVMPTYLGTLSQPQAAAIVEFIKSLKDVPPKPKVALPQASVTTREPQLLDEGAAPAIEYAATRPATAERDGEPARAERKAATGTQTASEHPTDAGKEGER